MDELSSYRFPSLKSESATFSFCKSESTLESNLKEAVLMSSLSMMPISSSCARGSY